METAAVGQGPFVVAEPPRRGLAALSSEEFFRILVTELQQQDPFEPSSSADMINQISQIRSIELSGNLSDSLDALVRQQRISGVSDLIGKLVTARRQNGNGSESEVEGVVTGVRFELSGAVLLELDSGEIINAADVSKVTTLDQAAHTDNEADVESEDGGKEQDRAKPSLLGEVGEWIGRAVGLGR